MSSSSAKTQQQSSTANTDNRVAVTDDAIYAGMGSSVDRSINDSRDFSDRSTTTINTTDARQFIDNSVHETLDGEVARAAIEDASRVAQASIDAQNLGNQASLEAYENITGKSLDSVTKAYADAGGLISDLIGRSLDAEQTATESAQNFARSITSDLYKANTSADSQTSADLIKYGALALLGIGALFAFRRK